MRSLENDLKHRLKLENPIIKKYAETLLYNSVGSSKLGLGFGKNKPLLSQRI